MSIPVIKTSDYHYDLPPNRIAKYPLSERDGSKLLVLKNETLETNLYRHVADFLPENSLLLMNNSKVIPARLIYVKESSGVIELFCLEPCNRTPYEALQDVKSSRWICMIGGLKKWKTEQALRWQLHEHANLEARFVGSGSNGFEIEFTWNAEESFAEVLEQLGQMPIPPYLLRKAEKEDKHRYQTVFASVEGSVAAPTAGLHFTDSIFHQLEEKNITTDFLTLHVGAGTFKPLTAEFAHQHEMHSEWVQIKKETIGQILSHSFITCVGTTSLRTLESLYWFAFHCFQQKKLPENDFQLEQFMPYENGTVNTTEILNYLLELMNRQQKDELLFKTALMIMPGYEFKLCNALLTNFHQPQSTLLMLVDAFTNGKWRMLYDYALRKDFRFLSYGDGCLLLKQ